MMAMIMREPVCNWYFEPPRIQNEKVCLALELNCPDSELDHEESLLKDLCSFYVVPDDYPIRQGKNPHCDICKGKDISWYTCKFQQYSIYEPHAIPSLHIFFDFSSSSHSLRWLSIISYPTRASRITVLLNTAPKHGKVN